MPNGGSDAAPPSPPGPPCVGPFCGLFNPIFFTPNPSTQPESAEEGEFNLEEEMQGVEDDDGRIAELQAEIAVRSARPTTPSRGICVSSSFSPGDCQIRQTSVKCDDARTERYGAAGSTRRCSSSHEICRTTSPWTHRAQYSTLQDPAVAMLRLSVQGLNDARFDPCSSPARFVILGGGHRPWSRR